MNDFEQKDDNGQRQEEELPARCGNGWGLGIRDY